MKNLLLVFSLLTGFYCHGQLTVTDQLNWVGTGAQTSATSPNFDFCKKTNPIVNYTLSTTTGNFQHVSGSGNPSLTNGVIFPANTSVSTPSVSIQFTFNQPVNDLRIRIVDLDIQETISGISPTYSSLSNETGNLVDPGSSNQVNASIDNSAGWIEWIGQSTTVVNLTYNRPGSGFGLVIDEIQFSCTEKMSCKCNAKFQLDNVNGPNADGRLSTNLILDSQGEEISKVCVELPSYLSLVDDACLKCDAENQETFGSILGAQPISGTSATIHDPLGSGVSRKICYEFATPTILNGQVVQLDLLFPPVLDLSCCKNQVSYCLDIQLKKEDCTSCEYTVCSKGKIKSQGNKSIGTPPKGNKKPVRAYYNDRAELNQIRISPNPAMHEINIELSDQPLEEVTLHVFDMSGREIKSLSTSRKRLKLDVSTFAPGQYVVSYSVHGKTNNSNFVVK